MDPFTAIGLAGNIITFLDYGYKLVRKAKEIHASASGASADNENITLLTKSFQDVASSLQSTRPASSMTNDEIALNTLALECHSLTTELLELLERLKSKNPKSKRDSIRAVFRGVRKKEQKTELEQKLDRCKQQLNLQVTSLTRYEI